MATKLQNLERVEAIARSVDATVTIDREPGTGQWTVSIKWSADGLDATCRGRAKSLDSALVDAVARAESLGL